MLARMECTLWDSSQLTPPSVQGFASRTSNPDTHTSSDGNRFQCHPGRGSRASARHRVPRPPPDSPRG